MTLYPLNELLLLGTIMTCVSVLQGAIGFASGLVGVPLLLLFGFSLPEAATINLVSTFVQNFTGAWRLWPHLDPRELALPVAIRFITIPLGTYALWWTDQFVDPGLTKQLVGALLLVVVGLLWGFRVTPRDELNLFWKGLAYSTSGFLLGFAAIGAAPLVLYVNSLTWTTAKSRAFLFFCAVVGQPLAAWFYWTEFRWQIVPAALSTLLFMPTIILGLSLGLYLGHRISKPLFRKVTFALIAIIAVATIVSPLVRQS